MESSRSRLLSISDKEKKFGCFSDPNVSKVVLNMSSVEFSNLEFTIYIYILYIHLLLWLIINKLELIFKPVLMYLNVFSY